MDSLDTHNFDWANDAFVALNDGGLQPPSEKWPAFSNSPSFSQSSFTVPPSTLNHGVIERFGQITPPEERSPADQYGESIREGSIPLDQLKNEALFPDHQLQALQDYRPRQSSSNSLPEAVQEPSPKRRRTSRAANQARADPAPSQPTHDNPQPPKRKRGRPKSQPQMVEAFTADGFPFQVSSARQSHLEKNRVAAHKCRQRKKEYIGGLEERAREFTSKNKALKENVAMLREELLELKNEVLRHAGCGFWAVDEYLTRCAGDLLGMQAPQLESRKSSQVSNTSTMTLEPVQMHRETSSESMPSGPSMGTPDHEEFGGFDLLEDIEEEHDGSPI